MATENPRSPAAVIREYTQRRAEELRQRRADEKDGKATLLRPEDVRGELDAGRKLMTTLGGQPRVITSEDLKTFAKSVKALGAKYKGGITAKEVIDLSMPDRLDRARNQIKFAIPMRRERGSILFTTDTGPDSKVHRHYVWVDFLDFEAALASPVKVGTLARRLATGKLAIGCSCEDWKYGGWAYMATVGKYIARKVRPETGFPKIKNPKLNGVACKHTLRVMRVLTTAPVLNLLEQMILDARDNLDSKAKNLKKGEAELIAAAQERQRGRAASKIETSTERAQRLSAASAAKAKAVAAVVKKVAAKAKAAGKVTVKEAREMAAKIGSAPMSEAQRRAYDAFLATLQKSD